MRTQGQFLADTPHFGGRVFISASDIAAFMASGAFTFTRNAGGDYSWNLGASLGPLYLVINLESVKRILESPPSVGNVADLPFQEQFGTASGGTGYPAGAPGLPPFTGVTQLTQPTAQPPKGIRLNSFGVIYLITGAALTGHTVNLYRTTYANNVALSIATVPTTGSLSTATQANPYVTTVTVTTPTFETTDLTSLQIEVAATTQAAGAYRFYGAMLNVDFNYD